MVHGRVQPAQSFRGHANRFGPRRRKVSNARVHHFGGAGGDGQRPLSQRRQRKRRSGEQGDEYKAEGAEFTDHISPHISTRTYSGNTPSILIPIIIPRVACEARQR
jgi:hypothetical protein